MGEGTSPLIEPTNSTMLMVNLTGGGWGLQPARSPQSSYAFFFFFWKNKRQKEAADGGRNQPDSRILSLQCSELPAHPLWILTVALQPFSPSGTDVRENRAEGCKSVRFEARPPERRRRRGPLGLDSTLESCVHEDGVWMVPDP